MDSSANNSSDEQQQQKANNGVPIHDVDRVEKLGENHVYHFHRKYAHIFFNAERDLNDVETLLKSLDTSMHTLLETIETMKPAYLHAMKLMSSSGSSSNNQDQKNNLIFHGLAPEPLELQMEKEPEFCRDILETRVKLIFRETLKISRDIPFSTVYRFTTANPDPNEVRPIVACFRSLRDKENILRHANSSKQLKQKGVYVTEDFSNKNKPKKKVGQSQVRRS